MSDKETNDTEQEIKETEEAESASGTVIFRPWRTLPDGTVIWAKDYGLRAWPIHL